MKRNKLLLNILIVAGICMVTGCGNGAVNSADNEEIVLETSVSEEEKEDTESAANEVQAEEETEKETESDLVEEPDLSDRISVADAPVLSDSMEKEFGAFAGCAVTGSEISDEKVWEIITTHFNAVTLGNELKPDCTFGYSNGTVPGTETVTLNGEELLVPKMDHSRADKMLNKILKWNEENPDRQLKVRGHVLVWHSQTPEWFFHEDYKKGNPYVDKETMDKRLEWYIKTMLEYYTGEDSKYKDLFYGWDVVNEAVSDGGGYRTDKENPSESKNQDTHGSNSSWWAIYGSNEYIIKAFTFANKYAPESLELYYNDYNETNALKQKTIKELLTELKEKEGAPGEGTRISAMGMQGHYNIDAQNPSSTSISTAIVNYARIVGNVQITELDLKISDPYDASKEGIEEMNETLRKRYNLISFAIKSAQAETDVNVTGVTFWGTVDHYSWLQSKSNVGGGNTTTLRQMPLLFDEYYLPKPCFFVFGKDN